MNERVRVQLQPLGETIEVEKGTPLRDVLLTRGVDEPAFEYEAQPEYLRKRKRKPRLRKK